MAGITFNLKKHIGTISLSEALFGEFSNAVENTGYWWLTIFYLVFIGWVTGFTTQSFKIYVILTFATVISMFFSSFLVSSLSRHFANKLFLGSYKEISSNLCGAVGVGALSSFILSFFLVALFSDIPLNQKIIFATLTSSLTGAWITNAIMYILLEKKRAFLTFIFGFGIGFIFIFIFGRHNINIFLEGLAMSFATILFVQLAFIVKGYSKEQIIPSLSFFKVKDYFYEIVSLLFFTIGIWIDKIVFWFMPQTTHKIDSFFRYSNYDLPFFIAFTMFSISPFIMFRNFSTLIRKPYQNFVNSVRYNLSFSRISQEKQQLIAGYRNVFYSIIYIYGSITILILIALSANIINPQWHNPFIFYHLTIGTFFLSIFFFNYLIMQYLNLYKMLALLCIIFALLNGAITYICINYGSEYDGLGFLTAALISAIISAISINSVLNKWEYEIFREASKKI